MILILMSSLNSTEMEIKIPTVFLKRLKVSFVFLITG